MDRSTALTVVLLLSGVALVAVPLVAPATPPPDRVEFAVEPLDGEEPAWETLNYTNFSDAERAAFDAALANASDGEAGYYNTTVEESPPDLTPNASSIQAWDVRYDGAYYLLQVKHFTYETPAVAVLARLGSLVLGVILAAGGVYNEVV